MGKGPYLGQCLQSHSFSRTDNPKFVKIFDVGNVHGHDSVEARAHVCKAGAHSNIVWLADSLGSPHLGQ